MKYLPRLSLRLNTLFFIAWISLILLSSALTAQDNPRPYPIDIIPASPNAANLQQYGDVPVSLFNGLPTISIPLMEVSDRDLSLPISLSYHASGINPEQHPGWVGLGWSLQAGGVITRSINGAADEVAIPGRTDSLQFAYYDNYDLIDRTDWDSQTSLARYNFTTTIPDLAIPAPDEFRFTFMGYSGSFYLNHQGEWVVKSRQNIALSVEAEEPAPLDVCTIGRFIKDCNRIARTLQKFTITAEDGTKYTFGGDTSSIEFTQALGTDDAQYYSGVVSKSWYLTHIETIDGRQITLEYQAGRWQAEQAVVTQLYDRTGSSDSQENISRLSNPRVGSANLINPVYLTRITTPNAEVRFQRSITNELSYNFQKFTPNPLQFLPINIRDEGGIPTWYKLDRIQLLQKGDSVCRQYVIFEYNDDPGERLMLKQVQVMGQQTAQSPYVFSYNQDPLPEYNAQKQDHWGYYNGRNYFEDNPLGTGEFYGRADAEPYYLSREAVVDSIKAGVLEQIVYPTGGTTTFTYEAHQYAQVATNHPFSLIPVVGNLTAGGLRIASTTSSPGNGYPDVVKTYHYVRDYLGGGTVSSGILSDSANYVTEYDDGTITNWELTSVPVEPFLTTDGNHVTYSEVAEVLADGSFTIYKYTNHDDEVYRDEDANATYVADDDRRWRYDPFTSRELERGNLLTKTMYAVGNTKVREEQYTYNSDPDRFTSFVRYLDVKHRSFYLGETQILDKVFDTRITAYQEYTYTPYLTSRTERTYDQQDTSRFVETVYTYQYDNPAHNQLTRTRMVDSEGGDRVTTYRYAPDFSNNEFNSDTLVARHIYTPALLQIDSLDTDKTFQLERIHDLSAKNTAHIVLDSTITYPSGEGSRPVRVAYQYDSAGNIVQVQKEDDLPASFVWGYNHEHPIAEVINAVATDVFYTGFEDDTNSVSSDGYTGKQSYQGNYLVELPSAGTYVLSYWQKIGSGDWTFQTQTISATTSIGGGSTLVDDVRVHPTGALMTHYTYDPIYGQTSVTAPNRLTNFFEYDGLGRLKLTRDHQARIEQSYFYRYQR